MKNTRFAEGKNLQLRFEFFNAMNHANFDPPTTTVNGGTFGRVTTANQNLQNARQIQLGLRFSSKENRRFSSKENRGQTGYSPISSEIGEYPVWPRFFPSEKSRLSL